MEAGRFLPRSLEQTLNIAIVWQGIVVSTNNAAVFGAHEFEAYVGQIRGCRVRTHQHQSGIVVACDVFDFT